MTMSKFKFNKFIPVLETVEGTVKMDEDCVAELSPTLAQILADNGFGSILEGGEAPEAKDSAPEKGPTGAELSAQEGTEGDAPEMSDDELLKQLLKKSVEELKALCVEYGIPEAQFAKLTKMQIVNLLIEASKI